MEAGTIKSQDLPTRVAKLEQKTNDSAAACRDRHSVIDRTLRTIQANNADSHRAIEKSVKDLGVDVRKDIGKMREEFRNRLPLWATAISSVGLVMLGWMAHALY